MNRLTRSALCSATLVLILAGAANATDRPLLADSAGGPGNSTEFSQHAERFRAEIERLQLDAVQRQSLQKLAEQARANAFDLRQRADAIREQMMAVDPDSPRYATVTTQASAASADLAADGTRLLADFRARVHRILTPEQRDQLKARTQTDRREWDAWRERHKAKTR